MQKLKASNIHYEIGDRTLLNIDELVVHHGDRIGLVGKNGQGKTMLFQYLMNELLDTANVKVSGTVEWLKQLNDEEHVIGSGGEITQQKINRAFLADPDVLLLDEPTNNLDIKHIQEVEERLKSFDGAYIVISHDRDLLEHVCDQIWELQGGKLHYYRGSYSFYEQQKEIEKQQQIEEYEKYQKEKNRLQETIRSKQDQAGKMRKPPSRMSNSEWQLGKNKAAAKQKKVQRVGKTLERKLERLSKVEKPFEQNQLKMSFNQVEPIHHKYVMDAEQVEKKGLYRIPRLQLKSASKTALLGPNGCGKTTLFEQILKRKEAWKENAKIGIFQQNLTKLPDDQTIYEYVSEDSVLLEAGIRTVLARLHFYRNDVFKKVGLLSGGEKVKAALAKLLVGDYNVLLLDEPNNHLDVEARKALESLIQDYPGTVLYVTHDRRFIKETANQLWVMEDETVKTYDGTYDEWEMERNKPASVSEEGYDTMALETKLTELISRLSMPSPHEDLQLLEEEYEETLKKLNKRRI
ncbi:ABC-F type ribosomal protection protein [Halobacillus andaensis]|uniref:ABC-F type ribosomal protection protein n=1 Tax=Halobacillus andaensis TaxID=1176239 RepID=A0A917EUP2_HALAA|nr:ABC-F family ATP-binding cassette domain-containing protein [Halobacillus andaensis]MBP2004182.1 macrolide transport system ATP-binding/permease protein/pleuromutilin/lincosamide/streptogramin A transport system ATP-binding/permease protein [Halobacillus andaensis]GGF16422.1 ABC-F type ribosomal protection protein [Halobacillus andaensis]